MPVDTARVTLIDGPTMLIELGGLRLLTDPTFDPPQTYQAGGIELRKLNSPPVSPEALLPIDAVLLSHDQHLDNLDIVGRRFLPSCGRTFSTPAAQSRLGGNTAGLATWAFADLPLSDGRTLRITSTPARHGPVGIEPVSGDVTGFVLSIAGSRSIYISGDTVWFPGVAEVADRFDIGLAILFTGSARPRGAFHMTMDANDAIEVAARFKDAQIIAIHNQGWAHLTESQAALEHAFALLGLDHRLHLLQPMTPTSLAL